jgi:hypothetical protein
MIDRVEQIYEARSMTRVLTAIPPRSAPLAPENNIGVGEALFSWSLVGPCQLKLSFLETSKRRKLPPTLPKRSAHISWDEHWCDWASNCQ